MTLSPGTHAIVEITIQLRSGDPPRDYVTNHLSFTTGATPGPSDWQALADSIKTTWSTGGGSQVNYSGSKITVIAYDRADAKPRPEKAVSIYNPGTFGTADVGPRQVALCSSFYCLRNLKRTRGRVYLFMGTWMAAIHERPSTTDMNAAMQLMIATRTNAHALVPVWDQEVVSGPGNSNAIVDHNWVNDVWDTQRRRAPKETTRVHSP